MKKQKDNITIALVFFLIAMGLFLLLVNNEDAFGDTLDELQFQPAHRVIATPAKPYDEIAQDMRVFANAYIDGDIDALSSLLAEDFVSEGKPRDKIIESYRSLWADTAPEDREIRFIDVTIENTTVTAWLYVKAEKECMGIVRLYYNPQGQWRGLDYECFQDFDWQASGLIDGADIAQLSDVGSTAIGFANGLVEGNPAMSAMIDAGGFPLLGLVKLAANKFSEYGTNDFCLGWKESSTRSGFGLTAFNLLLAFGVNPVFGAASAVLVWSNTGDAFEAEHAISCRANDEIHYRLITHTQEVPTGDT